MINSVYNALQRREIALDCVGRNAHAIFIANVFIGAMVNLRMFMVASCARQNRRFIGHQVGALINHLIDDWSQVLSRYALDVPKSARRGHA